MENLKTKSHHDFFSFSGHFFIDLTGVIFGAKASRQVAAWRSKLASNDSASHARRRVPVCWGHHLGTWFQIRCVQFQVEQIIEHEESKALDVNF